MADKHFILAIDPPEVFGKETQPRYFVVIVVTEKYAEIIGDGYYSSYEEAKAAWPEAN